jgi:hypothetical protein
MFTYEPSSVRIFKDDSAKTVENALNDVFYGANSPGTTFSAGYPSATLDNVPFNLADYEITPPTDLGETVDITNNTTTVTASDDIFSEGDVGKFLWDATVPTDLKLIGKIASHTADDVVELENNYLGTTLTGATCYISSSANNNTAFNPNGEFIILIATDPGAVANTIRIPNLNESSGGLKTGPVTVQGYSEYNYINSTYINLLRISKKGIKEDGDTAETIPATITRLNTYLSGSWSEASGYFPLTNNFPLWVAYKINPFGGSTGALSKNTTYSLEISDTIPYYEEWGTYTAYASASAGYL